MNRPGTLGWGGIGRLGLVQACLGAIVVLATSTMNRIMVVELALPAIVPGALVGWHYAVQILRPRFGFGSDVGGRRTPWIIAGIAVLGIGAVLAALAIGWMAHSPAAGIALAVIAFMLIGAGAGAAGTSLLVLLAKRVGEHRRAVAATVVWVMMIAGFVATTVIVGLILDPYSATRLLAITIGVAVIALALTLLAMHGMEPSDAVPSAPAPTLASPQQKPNFGQALAQVWSEPKARRFTIFIFVSMLAYSAQELILEPFAGSVFAMTPGQSTQLSGVQHSGVLLGMILVGVVCTAFADVSFGSLRSWTIAGCIASALALAALAAAGWTGTSWPLKQNVFLLGMANGVFAVAAIGSMMSFAGAGRESREGVRMGLWGAAQAIAFGLGGFLGAAGSDVARMLFFAHGPAYAVVFGVEAGLFLVAAKLAANIAPIQRSVRAVLPNRCAVASLGLQEIAK